MRAHRSRLVLVAVVAGAISVGCSDFPRDAAGALERVRGGELRAGAIDNPPWITWSSDDTVAGVEARLVEAWAGTLRARVRWQRGDTAGLTDALHRREIDVLAGGLRQETPYAAMLALTQPYLQARDAHGESHRMVLAVTPGESALLLDLDRFLASPDARALFANADRQRNDDAAH